MLAVIRLLLLALFVVGVSLLGLLICLVRPFYAPNTALFGRWFSKGSRLFGVTIEIRQSLGIEEHLPCVFVANHQNNYDLFTLSASLIPGTVSIGKKSLKWIPFFGQLYWLAGNILIDRANRSKAVGTMQGAVEHIVEKKVSVWVFPEGTRSYGRGLLPFKTGAFHIAQQANVPVVPMVMSSTSTIKLNRWNNGKVIIQMLAPVPSAGVPVRELMENVREHMLETLQALDSELARD